MGGLWYKYIDLPGVEVPLYINPCPAQVSAEGLRPPRFWNPLFIDCETVELSIPRPLNESVNPYTRRRPYHRGDIEYVEDSVNIEDQRRLMG